MTNSAARQIQNLEWCRDCLTHAEFPPPDWDGETQGADAAFETHFAKSWARPFGLVYLFGVFQFFNRQSPFALENVCVRGNQITFTDRKDHRWALAFDFDSDGNISDLDIQMHLAGGLTLRDAQGEDFNVIEKMDETVAIPIGGGACHINRQGTIRQCIELLGDNRLKVIEEGRRIVAVGGAATFPIMIGGRRYNLCYANHFRTDESVRKLGLTGVLSATVENNMHSTNEGAISVIHGENTYAMDLRAFPWKTGGKRVILNCNDIAGEAFGAPVSEADSEDICPMINQAHSGQEWFLPYTAQSLTERLSRSPEAYAWSSLRKTERAVAGCWFSSETRRYVLEDKEWSEVRAQVLDYGFAKDGLEDLERILRSFAAEALTQGMTHLALFSTEQAPAWPLLERLAERIEPYHVSCTVPEPEDASQRGVYIDPVLA